MDESRVACTALLCSLSATRAPVENSHTREQNRIDDIEFYDTLVIITDDKRNDAQVTASKYDMDEKANVHTHTRPLKEEDCQ